MKAKSKVEKNRRILRPPRGYPSWLAYAVATMDTRLIDNNFLSGNQPQWPATTSRQDFVEAAKAELASIPRRAAKPEIFLYRGLAYNSPLGRGWTLGADGLGRDLGDVAADGFYEIEFRVLRKKPALIRTPAEIRIRASAAKLFSSEAAISEWLSSPALALNGAKPLEHMKTKRGAREVERLLIGMAHGNVL